MKKYRCNKNKTKNTKPSPAIKNKVERLSPLAFFCKVLRAGMTVEAAIVLPLCLFFLVNLGCAIEMIRIHNHLQLGMYETGNKAALYGCEFGGKEFSGYVSSVYVLNGMADYVGQKNLENSPMTGGKRGFRLWESSSGDELDITVMYSVSPLLSLMGFDSFYMANRYCAHLWNGYDISGVSPVEEIVYVTETGEVWHKNRECTYLQLSVKQVAASGIDGERNQWGSRYEACSVCAKGMAPGMLYITMEGEHYHYRRECPGLKRTVYSISKEDADNGGYRRCSRCGGR